MVLSRARRPHARRGRAARAHRIIPESPPPALTHKLQAPPSSKSDPRFNLLLSANLTSVGADRDTAIAAGQLQTSGLASRAATGLGFSQLLPTSAELRSLADSARLRAAAQDRNVATTRAQVLLQVDQAYYSVLASDAVLNVAQARVEMQRVTLRQVRALAASSLKSTLDVSFAEVSVSEAELALVPGENAAKANHALLSAAIGDDRDCAFAVADVPLPGPSLPMTRRPWCRKP